MRGFISLLRQDLVLAHRNAFFLMVVGLALLFALLINFVLPEEIDPEGSLYVVDVTQDGRVESFLLPSEPEMVLGSEEELMARLEADRDSIGVLFKGDAGGPQAVIYYRGDEPTRPTRAAEPIIAAIWKAAHEIQRPVVHRVEYLRPGVPKVPYNKFLVPLVLVVEVVFLGFFFVAVMVFQEKAEGSIRAFRVTPMSTWHYILSKVVANLAVAFVYGALISLLTLGLHVDYLRLFLLLALASFMMTMVGLLVGVFYSGLSDFVYSALAIVAVLGLPMAGYLIPAFKLPFFEYIPTYSLVFGAKEIIFPTGRADFFGALMLPLLLETAAITLLTKWIVDRRLMREV